MSVPSGRQANSTRHHTPGPARCDPEAQHECTVANRQRPRSRSQSTSSLFFPPNGSPIPRQFPAAPLTNPAPTHRDRSAARSRPCAAEPRQAGVVQLDADHGGGWPWPAVHACLAGTDRAVLAMDAQQAPALDQERLELFDPGRGQVAEARGMGRRRAAPPLPARAATARSGDRLVRTFVPCGHRLLVSFVTTRRR